MILSERQLLLLDELMYFSKSVKNDTIENIIGNYKNQDESYNIPAKDLSGGITVKQAEEILKEIEEHLMLVTIIYQNVIQYMNQQVFL